MRARAISGSQRKGDDVLAMAVGELDGLFEPDALVHYGSDLQILQRHIGPLVGCIVGLRERGVDGAASPFVGFVRGVDGLPAFA